MLRRSPLTLDVTPLVDVSPDLVRQLNVLGDEYGPLGVALAAAQLSDTEAVRRALRPRRRRRRQLESP